MFMVWITFEDVSGVILELVLDRYISSIFSCFEEEPTPSAHFKVCYNDSEPLLLFASTWLSDFCALHADFYCLLEFFDCFVWSISFKFSKEATFFMEFVALGLFKANFELIWKSAHMLFSYIFYIFSF